MPKTPPKSGGKREDVGPGRPPLEHSFKPGNTASVGHGRPPGSVGINGRLREIARGEVGRKLAETVLAVAAKRGDLALLDYLTKLDEPNESISPGAHGLPTKEHALADPEQFAIRYVPHWLVDEQTGEHIPFAQFHRDLFTWAAGCHGGDRYAQAVPREHGKTTALKIIYLWLIATKRKRYIVHFGPNRDDATETMADVKDVFENNGLFRADFGDLVGKEKWTEAHWKTSTGVTVRCRGFLGGGRGSGKGGSRPDFIGIDDIDKDEHIASPTQRAKIENKLRRAISNLGQNSDIILIGTILHYDSSLAIRTDAHKAKAAGIKPWKCQRLKAIGNDGAALWPEKWGLAALGRKREEIGSIAFACEYQNEPSSDDQVWFQPSWFRWFKFSECRLKDDDDKPLYRFFGYCDPAISKKNTADFTAIVTIGVPVKPGPKRVFDIQRFRGPVQEICAQILAQHKRWDYEQFGCESIGFQEAVREELARQCAETNVSLSCFPCFDNHDKMLRIRRLSPLVEFKHIEFEENLINHPVYEELIHHGFTDHDDCADAVEGCNRITSMMPAGVY